MLPFAHSPAAATPFRVGISADEAVPHENWLTVQERALAAAQRLGLTAILGEAGTGKSLMLRGLDLAIAESGGRTCYVAGSAPEISRTADVVLIDDAHLLPARALEALAKSRRACLITGPPNLSILLDRFRPAPLLLRLRLLAPEEVAEFVAVQLERSGQPADLLSSGAIAALARSSGGAARELQYLTGLAVFLARLVDAPHVSAAHVAEAVLIRDGTELRENEVLPEGDLHELPAPALRLAETRRADVVLRWPSRDATVAQQRKVVRHRRVVAGLCGVAVLGGVAALLHFRAAEWVPTGQNPEAPTHRTPTASAAVPPLLSELPLPRVPDLPRASSLPALPELLPPAAVEPRVASAPASLDLSGTWLATAPPPPSLGVAAGTPPLPIPALPPVPVAATTSLAVSGATVPPLSSDPANAGVTEAASPPRFPAVQDVPRPANPVPVPDDAPAQFTQSGGVAGGGGVSAAEAAAASGPSLPAQAILRVTITFMSGDAGAEERARQLARTLLRAGNVSASALSVSMPPREGGITYFFEEDAPAVALFAQDFGAGFGAPRLALRVPPPRPGTVNVVLAPLAPQTSRGRRASAP
ncbi:hypothetical protein [Roseomonas sp. BN140053]|uniref:hypothetical protein n=1 Tax=Roseomonas sp. BN140053 TaxID=3391898 RepID=UPI0039E8326C